MAYASAEDYIFDNPMKVPNTFKEAEEAVIAAFNAGCDKKAEEERWALEHRESDLDRLRTRMIGDMMIQTAGSDRQLASRLNEAMAVADATVAFLRTHPMERIYV